MQELTRSTDLDWFHWTGVSNAHHNSFYVWAQQNLMAPLKAKQGWWVGLKHVGFQLDSSFYQWWSSPWWWVGLVTLCVQGSEWPSISRVILCHWHSILPTI